MLHIHPSKIFRAHFPLRPSLEKHCNPLLLSSSAAEWDQPTWLEQHHSADQLLLECGFGQCSHSALSQLLCSHVMAACPRPSFSIMQESLIPRKTFSLSQAQANSPLAHCRAAKCPGGASTAEVEEFTEKKWMGLCKYPGERQSQMFDLPVFSYKYCELPSFELILTIPVSGKQGEWNSATGGPCSPADPLVNSGTGSFTQLLQMDIGCGSSKRNALALLHEESGTYFRLLHRTRSY